MTNTAAAEPTLSDLLLREDRDGIAYLTMNRPNQYNALSEEMIAAMQAELDRLKDDEGVRVVVLGANGKAFCAGHDLKQMRAHPEESYYRRLFASCSRMMLSMLQLPQPIIARVHGIATAAGCQLVATCDLAVAADTARFAVSGINVGLFCSTPGVALSRNLGRKQAFEMLITGDFIDAAEAREKGLINRIAAAADLDAEIGRLTGSICAKSPVAVRTGKLMYYRQLEMGVAQAYDFAGQVMAGNMMAEDAAEGIDAFMGKRPAVWKGR